MAHVSVEQLMNYMEGQAVADERRVVDAHVSTCLECAGLKREFQVLHTELREDASFEPPTELVQWGINLFQPMLQPAETVGGKIRKIIASLVFDTYDEPAPAGVRHLGVAPRQLLFRAGGVDVDVKIESTENNDRITLVGQVMSNTAQFSDTTPVKLESSGVVRYKTMTNLVGEFSFDEVPKDTYHLSLDLPEGQVTLFCVHRSNS